MHETQSWFAGVDWASQKHDVWLADASGKRLGKRTFEHSGEGLAQMCDWLIATSGGKPEDIHVAIEVPHGAVVETLLDRGFKVYAINPRQLDRFRDRFSPAGAKDDSRDAETLSSSLRTDRRAFHQVSLADPAIIELREWSRMADDLRADKIRHANRLREQLQRYYPQMLQFDSDLAEEWILALWEAAPTPAKAARLRQAEVEKLLKRHRIRRIGAAEVLAILKQPALIVAPGVTEAAVAHIRVLIESIRLFTQQLKEAHRQLDRLCKLLAEPIPSEEGTSRTGAGANPRSDTSVPARRWQDRPRRAARGGVRNPAAGRLRHLTHIVRRGPRHPAIGQKPRRHPKARLQSKAAECHSLLGGRRAGGATRRAKPSILL